MSNFSLINNTKKVSKSIFQENNKAQLKEANILKTKEKSVEVIKMDNNQGKEENDILQQYYKIIQKSNILTENYKNH